MAYPTLPTFTAGAVLPAASLTTLKTAMQSAPHFRGSILTATPLTASANVTFTATEDSESGWATNAYTVKVAGVYRLSAQFKWNGTSPSLSYIAFRKASANIFQGPATPSQSFGGMNATYEYRCAVNDVLAVQVGVGFTTQYDSPADGNIFSIDWLRA